MITRSSAQRRYIVQVKTHERRRASAFVWFLALYPAALLLLSLVHLLMPQRFGFLALTQVFAPFLFVPLLLLVPIALARGTAPLRLLLLACALVYAGRFPPHMAFSGAVATPDATPFSVLSANLRLDSVPFGELKAQLTDKPVDLALFQESGWQDLESDPSLLALYPYRLVNPRDTAPGLVLLSRYPILEHHVLPLPGTGDVQRVMWARLDLGEGRTLVVVEAHPLPPLPPDDVKRDCAGPFCYNTVLRDEQITKIRAFVDTLLARGESVLLAGDFNVTEREPAYRDISGGLHDAYLTAGEGNGNTWRPERLMRFDFALLRIDYMFTSPQVETRAYSVDCTPRGSDHCMQRGIFGIK